MRSLLLCFLSALLLNGSLLAAQDGDADLWFAWLETDGGPLGFGLEFEKRGDDWRVYLINEPERIPIDDVLWNDEQLRISIPHYDSVIDARKEGEEYRGTWRKVRGKDKIAEVPFAARRGKALPPRPMLAVLPKNVAGRWAVDFESDDLPALGIFEQEVASNKLYGTFLTATGDYRYLSGHITGADLTLSCFDGAHAFLFRAQLLADGTLQGEFRSGNWWKESWTARRSEDVQPVDGFRQTTWVDRASLADIVYPDTEGKLRNLGDPEFRGQAYLLQVFGSWCPNCHDEARYLVELHRRYGERGLSIIALAYELTGDFERDAEQVEIFKKRHEIPYPVLVAGTADKADATDALGVLDRVRSYPTTIFLSADGEVRAIHSGFAGPATGQEHQELRREFESQIETLLGEEPRTNASLRKALLSSTWQMSVDGTARGTLCFGDEGHQLMATWSDGSRASVHLLGDGVYIGERVLRYDAAVSVLMDVTDFGKRLTPEGTSLTPLFEEQAGDAAFLRKALGSQDTLVQREAIMAATHADPESVKRSWPELAESESLEVRIAAAWAAGQLGLAHQHESLASNLTHPNAALRRQTVRSLVKLARDQPALRSHLADMGADPDPLIRALVR